MPRKAMPWWRFYSSAPHDRKIRRLKPVERWVWVCTMCIASESPDRGVLLVAEGEPATEEDIADVAGVPIQVATSAVEHMLKLGLIAVHDSGAWHVPAWGSRQFASDTSTTRTRKHKGIGGT